MVNILQSLSKTVHLSLVIAILLFFGLYFGGDGFAFDQYFFSWLFRYLHVLAGIMWIGLLWYLNFVQIPSMPNIPDEQKPAIGKVIAPAVLFWFRWAALATLITGLLTLALYYGHADSINALTFTLLYGFNEKQLTIGIGMWLAIIMAYNVWMIIWPNQKKALGIVEADAETKAKSAATAKRTSRINTMLSIPMLLAMVGTHFY